MHNIFVFVLTLSFCQAPDGKTACEQGTFEYTFTDALDCVTVRNYLVDYLDSFSDMIIYREKSKCQIDTAWATTFADFDDDESDNAFAKESAERELEIALELTPYE